MSVCLASAIYFALLCITCVAVALAAICFCGHHPDPPQRITRDILSGSRYPYPLLSVCLIIIAARPPDQLMLPPACHQLMRADPNVFRMSSSYHHHHHHQLVDIKQMTVYGPMAPISSISRQHRCVVKTA
eukprot:GHVU01099757.1.p1 GENE.GHVU01099757.1~~GHVU01099757.1.p1  ORF type:complete len:130 (+),score=3.57 GHVU01099757.1:92-481(+)